MGPELCATACVPGSSRQKATAPMGGAFSQPFMMLLVSLLRLQSGFLDDLLGGGAVLLDETGERVGRAGDRLEPTLDEIAIAKAGLGGDARDHRLQARHDQLRRLGGSQQAEIGASGEG